MADPQRALPFDRPRARGDPLVEAELQRRLRDRGRITFAEFMEVALYLPYGGYYEEHVALGRRGDFLTSPETHPGFGALMARFLQLSWEGLGRPSSFDAIEYGAGSGSLCRQIVLAAPRLSPAFAAALRYHIIERSAFLRAVQQAELLDLVSQVDWVHPDAGTGWDAGCVLANEVVDAFPVHRVRIRGGLAEELYVGRAADRYLELPGPLSGSELGAHLAEGETRPGDGAVVEVNLAARGWAQDVARRLERGHVLTLDFGGSARELLASASPRGGLRCCWRHAWSDDPLDHPGLQDIAAPVDFTLLARAGEEVGLTPWAELSQAELLRLLGIEDALAYIEAAPLPVAARERNRAALLALSAPRGLGGFRALLQAKSAPPIPLSPPDSPLSWLPLLPEEAPAWPE